MPAGCLAEETIVGLIEGNLSRDEEASIDEHIDACPTCRSLLTEMIRTSTARLRAGSGALPDADPVDAGSRRSLLVPGEVISDRYAIRRMIGRGAMGVVYEARDQELDVTVAVKVLTPEAAAHPRLLDRLRKEIILGRRITHPNVCRLYDLGHYEGTSFLTMEYLEGETLERMMERGPIPMRDAWHVIQQVGNAMEEAHAHGVVHRDLKPANIMIGAGGKVTVMDFGLALDVLGPESQVGALVGTPAYWAPEQARGEKATERSDIFAMAVIFCELLGGKRPMWAERPDLTGVPEVYHAIIQRCLSLDPADRYPTVTAARRELDAARARLEPRRPYKRRFIVYAAVAGLLLGAAVTAVLLLVLR